VRNILNLDIERRGIEEIETAATEHALPCTTRAASRHRELPQTGSGATDML
jgi:hypothetical protein